MPRQIVRFYARALRPTWDFLDREMPPEEIVRRFGRSYGGEPLGGGWYLTVVLESESAAATLKQCIASQPDHSFSGGRWHNLDFEGAPPYSVAVDLEAGTRRIRLKDEE